MIEPFEHDADWSDMEALVREAGGYVRPSEELRPRVLETARAEAGEHQARRRIWQVALAIALLGLLFSAAGTRWEIASPLPGVLLQVPADRQQAGGDAGWSMVESFTDLRRRQAALLSLTR
jgi:hypothetical protein